MTYKKPSINQISVLSTSEVFYTDSAEAINCANSQVLHCCPKKIFLNGMLNHRLLPELLQKRYSLDEFSILKPICYICNMPLTFLYIVGIETATKCRI